MIRDTTIAMAETSTRSAASPRSDRRWPRRLLFALPAIAFVALVAALAAGLQRDPSLVPSPLVGRTAPAIDLPPVPGYGPGFSNADFRGKVSIVNVFASWCVSCRQEHPLLMGLVRDSGVAVYGMAYKDKPADTAAWLDDFGNPYAATGLDVSGREAIDWGVYGVPESFVIAPDGTIAYKQIGPITPELWSGTIAPLIASLQR
jgi:cytochrome c biogenesis protein CcmG/thiol:disulfide interchange protein DsbE